MMYITDKAFSLEMLSKKEGHHTIGVDDLTVDEVRDAIAETSAGLNCKVICSDKYIASMVEKSLHVDVMLNDSPEFILHQGDEMIIVSKTLAHVPDHGALQFTHVWVENNS